MRLAATQHPIVPELVQIVDEDMPPGSARCVGRANTEHGLVWRTSGSPSPAKLRDLRAALVAAGYTQTFKTA